MQQPNLLSITRLKQLVMSDLRSRKYAIVMSAGIIAVLALLAGPNMRFYNGILTIGGLLITGHAFRELHNPIAGIGFLMLPASTLEKWLAKWLITFIGYTLFSCIIYMVFAWLHSGLLLKQWSPTAVFPLNLSMVIKYLVINAIFLLGAVTFKRLSRLKTFLCILGVYVVVACIEFVLALLMKAFNISSSYSYFQIHKAVFSEAFWILILLIIVLFCWLISYLKLTEYEVK